VEIKKTILSRIGWVYILVLIGALGILGKTLYLQLVDGEIWKERAESMSQRTKTVPANRGNILDAEGNPIASTIPTYDLAMDPNSTGMSAAVFEAELAGLTKGLAELFRDKSAGQYQRIILQARQINKRHLPLKNDLSYRQAQQVKQLPLFRHGQYKGGIKLKQKYSRVKPYESLAKRTIGYVGEGEDGKMVGLEGRFDSYLRGQNGMRFEYRLGGNDWIPTSSENILQPKDGSDVLTTIDMNYQDVAEQALTKLLEDKSAEHGCAVLMEVASGEIKAMVNLTRGDDNKYHEIYNYAVGEKHEPGSTFKLPALMAALEAGYVDLDDTVDTYKGEYKFYGSVVRDSRRGGYGLITVQQVLEKSSNIGMARIIERCYKDRPQQFINRLYAMGLKESTGIEVSGELAPFIKSPGDTGWSKTSLPFMAHGYELEMTPLQILTFYNAIANGGKMVAPRLVKGVKSHSHQTKSFGPRIIKNSICSKETIKKARILLEGVVKSGTATNLETKAYQIAGKTGTAVISQGSSGYRNAQDRKEYRASFVGYFPADKPAYSCIVVVTKPLGQYYGNVVAGTVFQDIADKVYATDLRLHPNLNALTSDPVLDTPSFMTGEYKASSLILKKLGFPYSNGGRIEEYASVEIVGDNLSLKSRDVSPGVVPDVTGMGLSDALPLLENMGLKVIVTGYGRIIKQSKQPGEPLITGQTIELVLNLTG